MSALLDSDRPPPIDLPPLDAPARQLRLPGIEDKYLGAEPPALCAPVIKFAGAKRWIVPLILPRVYLWLANNGGSYCEPFFGGGAFGFALGWPRSIFADLSASLVNLYQSLGTDPEQVADALDATVAMGTDEAAYYARRREVWPGNRPRFSQFEWAARMIYLNYFSFNGLLRTNSKGEFNVPYGKRPEATVPSRGHLAKAGGLIGRSEVRCGDFEEIIGDMIARGEAPCTAFLLDPPYGAVLQDIAPSGRAVTRVGGKETARIVAPMFKGYTGVGFAWADQERLAKAAARLVDLGALVIATNTWADPILDLYREKFDLFQVGVRHAVGATGARRGRRAEMLAIDRAHAAIFDAAGCAGVKVARVHGEKTATRSGWAPTAG